MRSNRRPKPPEDWMLEGHLILTVTARVSRGAEKAFGGTWCNRVHGREAERHSELDAISIGGTDPDEARHLDRRVGSVELQYALLQLPVRHGHPRTLARVFRP